MAAFIRRMRPKPLFAAAALLLFNGCVLPRGSGGGDPILIFPPEFVVDALMAPIGAISDGISYMKNGPRRDYTFKVTYSNHVEFNQSVAVSADSIFARLGAGDENMKQAAKSFFTPAQEVFRTHGIWFDWKDPTLVPTEWKLIFSTDYSAPISLTSKNLPEPFIDLVNPDILRENNIQCKMRVDRLEVGFSQSMPNQVTMQAEMRVEIFSEKELVLRFSSKAAKKLGDALRRDLHTAYYKFLKEKYDIKITPRFKGSQQR